MRLLSTVLMAGIAPLVIAAQASTNAPASTAPQPGAKVAAIDKVVCKKFPPPTGTRLRPRQICKTQVEWDLIRQEEWDALDRVQGRKPYSGG